MDDATNDRVPVTMRAAVYDRYGPPEVLHLAVVPTPVPAAGEVLVRVEAVSVNGGELPARAGKLRLVLGHSFPQRTGVDLVGTVVACGAGVSDLAIGERVWGVSENPIGTTAEYFAVKRDHVSAAPRNLGPIEAVTLVAGGTTALTALREHAHLRRGERLLVRGAAGGVGSLVVQVGVLAGARVTALASAGSLDFVRELGADEAFDHRATALDDLREFDVIVDCVGGHYPALGRHLAPAGRLIAITVDMTRPFADLAAIARSTVRGRRRARFFRGRPRTPLLAELARLAESGGVRPIVDEVYALDDVAAAHARLERGGVRGKIVIRVAEPAL